MAFSSQIAVVLVRPRNPLNVGAVARAMTDLGFADLRVVSDYAVPLEAAASAVDAAPVLASARVFADVGAAVSDCSLVYGTTALGERKLEHPVDVLREAGVRVVSNGGAVALLFGSEKTGLSNEELSHCHRLLTIPMATRGVSMNLGQAVAVCLYELARENEAPRMLPQELALADGEQLGRLELLLQQVLVASDYDRRFPGNLHAQGVRELVRRLHMPARDTAAWFGMFRQVLWKLKQQG